MRQFLITVAGTVVGIFTFFIVVTLIGVFFGTVAAISNSLKPKSEYVLTLDMRYPMRDQSGSSNIFGPTMPSVVSTVRDLHAAKKDSSVKGLLVRAPNMGMTPASAEELRLAILDFKDSGKFVITHSQGFDSSSVTGFQAVSASDEIWQQAASSFAVAGLGSEVPFYGGVFEKFGAKPEFEQFYEYKSAVNSYTKTGFTEAHRESTASLLTSIYNTAVAEISTDRKLERAEVERLLEAAPLSAEAAKDAGLIDKLGQYLEVEDYVKEKAGGKNIKLKSIRNYITPYGYSGTSVALIQGQGTITPGVSSDGLSPFSPNVSMGSDTFAEAFQDAIDDKSVKAIIFRVSSPGGSSVASDEIYDAVSRAQEAGKPVIVSMGQYAASGGYYVSAGADKIVAMPSTITGSIGVYGGKIALRDTFAKVGYNVDSVKVGGNFVGAFSSSEPFTQAQRAAYHEQLADIYEDFTAIVAKGRKLPIERVKEIAKGRVWTGEQAKDLGLVDELGGLLKAIEVTKSVLEIEGDKSLSIKTFPRPKSTQEQLSELIGGVAQARADVQMLRDIASLPEVQALVAARQNQVQNDTLMARVPEIE